jgi:hypothetical protein
MKNQKLLDTFTKPVCKECNEELYLFTGGFKTNPLHGGGATCLNNQCSNRYKLITTIYENLEVRLNKIL